MSFSVSIVISIKNEQKYVGELLNSIANQNYPVDQVETLVIDGGSTDKTLDVVSKYPFVKLYSSNCKLSEGKNIGVKNAKGLIVAFIDGDCVAGRDWLKNITKHFQENEEVVALGGPYIYADQKECFAKYRATFFSSVWFPKKTGFTDRPGAFGGGNSAYRKEVFDKIGYFNESLGRGARINSGEDVDFNLRLLNAGYKLYYADDIGVYHNYSTTFWEGCKQALKDGKDSSMYFAKFGSKGVATNLRNILLPLAFLVLGFLFVLGAFFNLPYLVYAILLIFPCYYLYKLARFYLWEKAVEGKTTKILAPFFDITLMIFWSIGSLIGLLTRKPREI